MPNEEKDPRALSMQPRWGVAQPLDPNWRDGSYHGHRMHRDRQRGAYGFHRLHRAHDLGGHGGWDGRYDAGPGRFDARGLYRSPFDTDTTLQSAPGRLPPADEGEHPRHVEDGGVAPDNRYLRQYNSASPGLDRQDAGHSHAPAGDEGRDADREIASRDAAPNEYGGLNQGGFAQDAEPGPDPRP